MRFLASILFVSIGQLLFVGCDRPEEQISVPQTGQWRMELDLGGRLLPFQFDLNCDADSTWTAHIHNASEDIVVNDVVQRGDSLFIRMPLFDSEFKALVRNDSLLEGTWVNHLKGPDYRIPFVARANNSYRFHESPDGRSPVSGSWETHFSSGTEDAYDAIALFEQDADGTVTGTFITETGDYRYLAGSVHNDSLYLSCFDGSHAFLFVAACTGDSLRGHFWSGTHWDEPWLAVRNPEFKLRDPDSLTALREGYDMVELRLPDLEGNMVSTHDARFKGKVLLVQIMGSWCPNCMDEASLLTEVHRTYTDRGLEVLAVAFEKYPEQARALEGLQRFRSVLGVEYPILYGGEATKEHVAATLPFLDHMMSYPTCIFVDRKGMVRRIRTGFYGPSTGEHYANYRRNLSSYIESLLAEPGSLAAVK